MVQILNYNEQFYLMTMDNSKFIDYKQFFKSFYKLPNSDNINRTHIFVSKLLDGKIWASESGIIWNWQ